MSQSRSIALACIVGVGSRDEPAAMAGASHFLEHLLFKGTTSRTSREINRSIDAVGGDFNAYTVRESTVFYLRVPSNSQRFAIELLAEVMSSPRFDPADVEIERGVILGELDGAVDSPDDSVFMTLADLMFPDHGLGRETLGDVDSISRMRTEEIAEFHEQWYRPANLVFAAAGDVDHDLLCDVVDGRFAGRPQGVAPSRTAPSAHASGVVHEVRPIEQSHLALGWRGIAAGDNDRFALALLNHALGDGPSSRLHEEIRERRGLAYAVSSSASSNVDTGTQSIYCATAPQHLPEVTRIIEDTLADLMTDGIDAEEMAVAKGYLTGSMLMALEDSSARMSRLGSAVSTHGRPIPIAESLGLIDSVTYEDVRRVAADIFGSERSTSIVGPSPTEPSSAAPQEARPR